MTRQPAPGARVCGARGRRRILVPAAALVLLLAGCSAADARGGADAVAQYEAALAPLKKRSDRLEEKFASVQGTHYRGPAQLRRVLAQIVPQYARLLERTRAIEVHGARLEQAHRLLVASLERQLDGLERDDQALLQRAGRDLEKAQALVERHRRVLAEARSRETG